MDIAATVPPRRSSAANEFDRDIDTTILRIACKELLAKEDVDKFMAEWTSQHGIDNYKVVPNGLSPTKKYSFRFGGPTGTVAHRVDKLLGCLRTADGWERKCCKTPGGQMAELYISADKNPKQVATEIAGKRLLDACKSTCASVPFILLRREGIVSSAWTHVVKIEAKPDGEIKLYWNTKAVQETQIPKGAIETAFATQHRSMSLLSGNEMVHDTFAPWARSPVSSLELVTWNTRALMTKNKKLRRQKITMIESLLRPNTILCLQECHGSLDHFLFHFERFTDKYPFFLSGCEDAGAGGVFTFIPKLGGNDHWSHSEVLPGRAQRVAWQRNDKLFIVWNIHNHEIQGDDREKLLDKINNDSLLASSSSSSVSVWMLGDFNLSQDSAGSYKLNGPSDLNNPKKDPHQPRPWKRPLTNSPSLCRTNRLVFAQRR